MSGFEAVAADIRSAGGEMSSAATGVKSADPSGSIGDVSTAMADSQSAAAANKLVGAWRERFQGWHDDAEAQGERMNTAAGRYDESDHRAAAAMRLLLHRTGEMR